MIRNKKLRKELFDAYGKTQDRPFCREAKEDYIWALAKVLEKTNHVRSWDAIESTDGGFVKNKINKIKENLKPSKAYKDDLMVVCLRDSIDDSFSNLEILDFEDKAIQGDVRGLVSPSPSKRCMFITKVVGFIDVKEPENSWGLNHEDYLKKKFKK